MSVRLSWKRFKKLITLSRLIIPFSSLELGTPCSSLVHSSLNAYFKSLIYKFLLSCNSSELFTFCFTFQPLLPLLLAYSVSDYSLINNFMYSMQSFFPSLHHLFYETFNASPAPRSYTMIRVDRI